MLGSILSSPCVGHVSNVTFIDWFYSFWINIALNGVFICHVRACGATRDLHSYGLIKKRPNRAFLVDPERFELSTFSMPLRRAPNCAMGPYSLIFFLVPKAPPIPRKGTTCVLWAHTFFVPRGPACDSGALCGPGGTRTLDLLSAIEARSQLRYRPFFQGETILPERGVPVKMEVLEYRW